jgi:tetratricopeptide (TPR) repeat protein
MNSVLVILLLLQSFSTPPRGLLENPAVATPIPKNIQKDYDKLWLKFLASSSAKDDTKVASDTAKLLKKNKDFPPLLLIQAYLSFYGTQPAAAEAQFAEVLLKDPANRIALFYLSEMAYSRSDFASASDLYARLFAVDTTHPELEPKRQRALLLAADSLLRAAIQAEQSGRLAETEQLYRQAIQRAPQSAELHGLLGGVLAKEMKWGEALAEFQRQIELSGPGAPNDETQRQMVEALTQLGRIDEARALADRRGGAGPRDIDQERSDKELEDLGRWGTEIARFRVIESSETIAREQLAVLLVRYFPQIAELPRTPQIMTDIQDSWAEPEIQTVVALGILDPLPNHTFQPSRVVTRGEFAVTMARLTRILGGKPGDAAPIPTPDLASSGALYQDVQLVLGYGMLSLDSTGKFGIDEPVTGKEAVNAEVQLTKIAQSFQQTR